MMVKKTKDNVHTGFEAGLSLLKDVFHGDVHTDLTTRLIYATDASAYREVPVAVAMPKGAEDIKALIRFATGNGLSLIPRTAGTSLAGQVVGNGIVVDVSRYMTAILEVNAYERWVRVEPGVILDELNRYLAPAGLFFGPETSTSNRCMIGGMVGNNACGLHSLVYGSTRDHTLSVRALLSDGSEAEFGPLSPEELEGKCTGHSLESRIYRNIVQILSSPENRREINEQYPDRAIKRRNTGYAIDLLLEAAPFTPAGEKFNLCSILAGSEGTLAFITEIKLSLVPLPPREKALVCVHCSKLEHAFRGNLVALRHRPVAVELMDRVILEQSKTNIEQRKNRFFISGDPEAILIVEFAAESREELETSARNLEKDMRAAGMGYHFPVLYGSDIPRVWALRKAGLGLLANLPGDAKPVAVIEDTSVNPEVLPEYMDAFMQMLKRYDLECVYHAHIATGELHLRPVLNLKDPRDVELFHTLALETARLVKKYRGSLSGEHGDGRLRGEFIPLMLGEKNYDLLKEIKATWDPGNLFNPGKIIATPPMNTSLRYKPGQVNRQFETIFNFSRDGGFMRSIEKCNGSADCRKTAAAGGTMCPSYMATLDEHATTRARANALREFLGSDADRHPFDHRELYDILGLCLSCKGCKAECPANVDMAKLKAEFLQHWYDEHGIPLRSLAVGYISSLNRIASLAPGMYNALMRNRILASLIKKILRFTPQRNMPALSTVTFRKWYRHHAPASEGPGGKGQVVLFADEFTNFNEATIGIKAFQLLTTLGYRVKLVRHLESGRTFISKGLIRKARKIAIRNINLLTDVIGEDCPLVGLEPSAILTFRDEYPDLCVKELAADAGRLAANTLMLDEFLAREAERGNIDRDLFTREEKKILLHGHCQQKAVASTAGTKKMLALPVNYHVEEIKSGCCGMAGSFGFEKEHYELSMKVGELVLFPAVRKAEPGTLIVAPGTSCRQQIMDGTGKRAYHPVEVLYDALL
jgi:FAD/FMN-containing dehydrogenase/Fe-S oxidoreductase